MKVLVTGGSGLLGSYLNRSIPDGVDAAFTYWTTCQPWTFHQMNTCDPSMVGHVMNRVRPEAVIHMAAEGSVDRCEREYLVAQRTNEDGTRNMLTAAQEVGARVLLTSTNAVYGGDDPPYGSDSERKPVNRYGVMRKRAEDLVMQEQGWQVVRLFLLYGWEPPGARDNIASKWLRVLWQDETVRLADDVTYMPTWAADAARAIWNVLLECPTDRAYNVAGESSCTPYEFVSVVSRVWGLFDSQVERASIDDFPALAPRPVDTSYDLADSANCGISCRGYREGLEGMRDELRY